MNRQLSVCAFVFLLNGGCATDGGKPPYNPDKPLGPCRAVIDSRHGSTVAVIDRSGGDGYASGPFGARLKVFVSGSFGKGGQESIPITAYVSPDQTEVPLSGPDGFTVNGGAPGSCEAFEWSTVVVK